MKLSWRSWIPSLLLAALVVVLDQYTKGIIERTVPMGTAFAPISAIAPYFKITHLTNTGAAFGLFQGQVGLLVVIAMVIIVAILVYSRHLPADSWLVRLALGLQLGGAIGNQIDRIQIGHVTDFLLFTLPVGDRVLAWPAWNVADGSIVVGVALLALVLLRAPEDEAPTGAVAAGEPE